MKRIFSLSLFVVVAVTLCAAKYKIVKLSTPTIVIGGKSCKVGSVFDDKEDIRWTTDNQILCGRNTTDGTYKYFAAKAFNSSICNCKLFCTSAVVYLILSNKASNSAARSKTTGLFSEEEDFNLLKRSKPSS